MHCIRKLTNDLSWVGANDRRLAMFEGVYSVPNGVSYNSYLLTDDVTVLFDTVDKAVSGVFFENIQYALRGRPLDYVIVQHMEPDHSAVLAQLLAVHPETTVVCNEKIKKMIAQFFDIDIESRVYLVKEGSILNTGRHNLTFIMAPMVHWPEVMVTYDSTDKILFSADAFGTFGSLNGAIFADEVDFNADYMPEARRYYTNIVGKYGNQVQALLKKASSVEIEMICPLHGFVWRNRLNEFIDKYILWSSYMPEESGVMIAYASIYGNTANAADILACRLRERGVKTAVYDVSVTPASEIIAAAFRYSHLVFASSTYNAGIFVSMENLLHDLAAHNIQNRTVAFIQNGSWAATSGGLMRKALEGLKNITYIDEIIDIRSSLKAEQAAKIDALAETLSADIIKHAPAKAPDNAESAIDASALFKLSYGLFVITAKNAIKDNGCIINTAMQLTDNPKRITVAVNKSNYTHDMIKETGLFNISVLSEDAPFKMFQHWGFQSGRDVDKFAGIAGVSRSANGIAYLTEHINAFISCKVVSAYDYGTHTLFVADICEAKLLDQDAPSVTYDYYFKHIKPSVHPSEDKKGFVCKICGYVYEGDVLPEDFICPLCKHGAADFERIG